MKYKVIDLDNLQHLYIINEVGEVFKVDLNTKKNLKLKPNGKHYRLLKKDGTYMSIKNSYLLLHGFYGGYSVKRKARFLKLNQPLHINNVEWANGFSKGIDYNYIHKLDNNLLTKENKLIKEYFLYNDENKLYKVIEDNKGLFYKIFEEFYVKNHFNDFFTDLKVKFVNMTKTGLVRPEENSNKIKIFLKLVTKYTALNILTKEANNKVGIGFSENHLDSENYKRTIFNSENDFEDIDEEIEDMFNFFSS